MISDENILSYKFSKNFEQFSISISQILQIKMLNLE